MAGKNRLIVSEAVNDNNKTQAHKHSTDVCDFVTTHRASEESEALTSKFIYLQYLYLNRELVVWAISTAATAHTPWHH